MRILYQLGLAAGLLLAAPVLLTARRRHYWPTLPGRLGKQLPEGPTGALWIHAVSVGEAMVAASVIGALPEHVPVLVTTITPTGQARARALVGNRATVAYLPFDLGWTLDPFLRRYQPSALVLVEGDYWPLLLSRVSDLGLPTAAINARIGDRTLARLERRPRWVRRLMGRVERFGAQSATDVDRLEALGIPTQNIELTGNLKYETQTPEPTPEVVDLVTELAADRARLVCGSTMPGEEDLVLDAFQALGGGAKALLILAPRHPERWDEAAATVAARGLSFCRRSDLPSTDPTTGPPDVLVLDSLGELAGLYKLGSAAFIGGTLSGTGGHNPLEPARFGVATAVGPSMENFRDMAADFDRAQAWQRVTDAEELGRIWKSWIDQPELALAVGARGRQLITENQGALSRTLELLAPILERFPPEAAR